MHHISQVHMKKGLCRANQANGGQLFRAGWPSSACTLYVFCSQKDASTHTKCFATSSQVTPRGGRRHVVTLERIHTTNLYMYMFCLTFPLLKQCESTVRRDVTGSYIMLLKGNGTRAARNYYVVLGI